MPTLDLKGIANDFWAGISKPPTTTKVIQPPAPKPAVFEARVGDGLTQAQTKAAYQKISEPDYAMDEVKANSFWSKIKASVEPSSSSIRLPFQKEATAFNAPPIVTEPAKFGFSLLEAVPRFAATLGGEFAGRFKPGMVKANIDLRRLGFETPDYVTASKEVTDAINNGANPFEAALRVASQKTLDLAFGATMLSDAAALSTKVLLSGGPEARIEAENVFNSYKANQKQVFANLKDSPLEVREKAMADITNAKNQAEKILKEQGTPSVIDRARVNTARYTEALSRQTPISNNFWADFSEPNLKLKTKSFPPAPEGTLQLPGYKARAGQAPAFGLSTEEVEGVGRLEGSNANQESMLSQTEARPLAEKAASSHYDSTISPAIKKGETVVISADGLKDHFGKDYNENNHPIYSRAAFKQFEKAITEHLGDTVYFTGGGPASGKTELVVNNIVTRKAPGVVYDSNMANYDGVVKQIEMSRKLGKNIEVHGVLADLEKSRVFSVLREAGTGRGISDKTFARGHAGFPEVLKKLIENGIVSKDEVYLLDTRNTNSMQQAIEKVIHKDYIQDPLAEISKLGYNEESLAKNYAKENFNRITGKRQGGSTVRQEPSQASPKNRTDQGIGDRRGDRSHVLEAQEEKIEKGRQAVYAAESKIKERTSLPDKVSGLEDMISVVKDVLETHPGKKLQAFISKREGIFEDFKNPDLATTTFEEARIRARNKKIMFTAEQVFAGTDFSDEFDNPDTIREQIDAYRDLRDSLRDLQKERILTKRKISELNGLEKLQNKDTAALKSYLSKQDKLSDSEIREIVNTKKGVKKESTLQKAIREEQQTRRDYLGKLLEATYEVRPPIDREIPQTIGEILEGRPITEAESHSLNLGSLPKILIDTNTPVKYKVGILDYFWTPDRVLKKIGLESMVKPLRHAYESYLAELPAQLEVIKHWEARAKEPGANKRIFQYLDGQSNKDYFSGKTIERLSPSELEVATEIKTYLEEWANRLGLPEDNRLSHYITHIFDIGENEKEFDEEVAKLINKKVAGSVYDPFLEARLGKKGYIEDTWRALEAYTKRATRKANMDPVLERIKQVSKRLELSQEGYVRRLVDKVNLRPTEIESLLDNTIKQVVGYRLGQRPVAVASGAMRRMVSRAFLGLNVSSAIKNLTQGVNTYAKLGEKYTAIGYYKLMTQGVKELEEIGLLRQDMVQDRTLSATRKVMNKTDDILYSLFELAEKINRGSAYWGAKSKAIAQGKSEMEAMEYGKKIVRDTQFQFGSIDTPVAMNDALTKTLTQFLSYGTKQSEFVAEMVKNKEYAGILRYIAASFALVYTLGNALNLKAKDFIPFYSIFERLGGTPPSLALPAEIFKAALNTPNKYGQPRNLGQKAQDILKTVPYPAKSQIEKSFKGIQAINQGGSFGSAGNLQFQQGQSTFDKVKSAVFGKYSSAAAQDFFNKSDTKDKQQAPLKKIYDQVQKLKAEGKDDEAQAVVDGLSDTDYAIYKQVRSDAKRANTQQAEKDMFKTVLKVKQLEESGQGDAAQAIVDDMTDEEYRIYQLAKKKL